MREADHQALPDGGQRRAPRKQVFVMVQLIGDFGEARAKLLDLSKRGARLDCALALNPDDRLLVTRGDLTIPARVTWANDRSAGLEFLEEVPPERLLSAASPGARAGGPKGGAAPFRITPMPALTRSDERRLARIWGGD